MQDDDEVAILLTRREVDDLISFTNEALGAIREWEFHARTGATPSDAVRLIDKLKEVREAPSVPS